jgi:AcrR family transcriptional regulator
MPRPYRLGVRAQHKAETRQRIIKAAAALYQERGIAGTTMPEVARRADVAPGTVLNHFSSPDELAKAVVDELVGSLRLPLPGTLLGLGTTIERVARLTRELFAFYERSNSWYQVYAREPGIPAWTDAEATFYRDFDGLVRAALGEDSSAASVTTVSAVLGGGFYSTLRSQGLPADDVADLVIDLLGPWLERRKIAFRSIG